MADVVASRALIDWAPRVGLERGLTGTIAWYRDPGRSPVPEDGPAS